MEHGLEQFYKNKIDFFEAELKKIGQELKPWQKLWLRTIIKANDMKVNISDFMNKRRIW